MANFGYTGSLKTTIDGLLAGKAPLVVGTTQVNLSADATTRQLALQTAPTFGPTTDLGLAPIVVDTTTTFQTVVGWGAALTDASAYNMSTVLTPSQLTSMLNEMFSASQGNCNLVRISIGASDFTTNVYTLDDEPVGTTDPNLADWALSSDDLAYKIPLLRRIRAINPNVKILACPWSPPAWMKNDPTIGITGTGSTNSYSSAYLQQWANYIVKYVQAYAAVGIPIHSVTPQNEPENNTSGWPSCGMSSAQQITFIGTYLGPALTAAGLSTKIWCYDHDYGDPAYPLAVLGNSAAAQYVDAVAWHWYTGMPEDGLVPVGRAYPNVKQIITEACGTGTLPATIANLYRRIFIGGMRSGSTGVILWNLILDQNGGPANHAYSPQLHGLYGINSSTGVLTKNADLWALLGCSRYVKPGAVRVRSSSDLGGIQTVAYLNPDRSTVLVAFNSTASTATTQVADAVMQQSFALSLPAGEVAIITWAGVPTGATAPAISVPAAPTLSATASKTGVTLTITAAASTDPIAVISVVRGGKVIASLPATTTSWTDTTATPGTAYTYAVYASNGGGQGANSATATATRLATTAPGAPGTPTIASGTLTWAASTDTGGVPITAYKVYRSTTSGAETAIATVPVTRSTTTITYTDPASGTNYYKVSAVNSVGEGALSAEVSYTSTSSRGTAPTTATQPALWLRADAITGAANGSTFTSWADSSGNGYTATVPSTGAAPTYQTAGGGSYPSVRFSSPGGSSAANLQRMVAPYPIKGEDVTMFFVGKLSTNYTVPILEGSTSDAKASGSPVMFFDSSNNTMCLGVISSSGQARSTVITPTSLFMIAASVDTAANSHLEKITANRQTTGTNTPSSTASAAAGLGLGGVGNDYTGGMSIDICEVIVFPHVLSDADRISWEAYLSQVYSSITVGSN